MRVELRDIRKHFGPVKANDGISLTLEPGLIYGLLGENGAGKSTLMKILSGYQPPDSGSILLDGREVYFASPLEALALGVGMLYQDPLDFPPMRVIENHLLGHDDRLIPDLTRAVREMSDLGHRFGFEVDPQTYVDTLTIGERQQLEVLRLLAMGAEVLILDEPTTGISAEQKDMLFATMRRLAHDEGKTIVLVSHKLEEVQELCDQAAVLRQGHLIGTETIPCPTQHLVRMMFGEEPARSKRTPFEPGRPVLELDGMAVRTYRLSVENIDLQLREGEVLGLAGLEGSGQGLLLRACAGLLEPRAGSIRLDGEPLKGQRSPFFWVKWVAYAYVLAWLVYLVIAGPVMGSLVGRLVVALLVAGVILLVGLVLETLTGWSAYHEFQRRRGAFVAAGRLEEGLVAGLSLAEHMVLAAPTHSFVVDRASARQETESRIKQYNVVGQPETPVDELSGGNQQRALFALLNSPLRLLLLEHPTRGLDVTSVAWVWELLQRRRRDGTAIVFISADLDELLEYSDRIAVFSGGVMSRLLVTGETSVEELGHLIGGER